MAEKHWIEQLAVDHGDLLLKYLKQAEGRAPDDVELLEKLFLNHDVHRGDEVLDLCCGYGRLSNRLAEKGYRVTGVDISPTSIEYGRRWAENLKIGDRVEFFVGDVRDVLKILAHKRGSYRAIISMFDSLGYYDDETDRRILGQSHELASNNGLLVLEVGNRDFLVKHLDDQPYESSEFDDLKLEVSRKLDLEKSRFEQVWKFYKKEENVLKPLASIPSSIRAYSLHELIALVGLAGWKFMNSYGTLDIQPVTPEVNRIIIVGKK